MPPAPYPVCVITGGSSGVGFATARAFGRLGRAVVVCGRDAAALQTARDELAAVAPAVEALPLDLTNPAAARQLIDAAYRRFGRVDVLVNNAGVAPLSPLEQIPEGVFQSTLAVNVAAVFHTTQAAWPVMRQQGKGVIINVSSLASLDPFPGFSVYGACKAWVNLFSKAAGDEGRPLGIRVYSVALGAVDTRLLRGLFPDFPADQTLTPDEVAEFLAGLCEDPMRHATGQTILLKK